jgi:integrase
VARAGKKIATIGDDGHMDYDEAVKAVIEWCDHNEKGLNRKYRLDQCISDYAKDLQRRKSAKTAAETERRLRYCIPEEMLQIEVAKLTTAMLEDWLHDLKVHESTANRTFNALRAALNLAFRRGIVPSDSEWRRAKAFRKADRSRELFLTDEQVGRLLDVADSQALRDLMRAAVLTGARYGELRNAKVKDLDAHNRSLKLDGKTGPRDCYLSDEALAFFKQQCRSKLPEAPLLLSEDGDAWNGYEHGHKVKRAARRAELPSETVFYSLRHYHISKAVGAGLSLLAIARNCGTSVKMIQDHYGKFTPDNMADMMNRVELGV